MSLFYKHKLHLKLLDISENHEEVYAFLESKGIPERGHILSPSRDIWFKNYHYLRFINTQGICYKHVTRKQKYEGVQLTVISFDEFKTYFE